MFVTRIALLLTMIAGAPSGFAHAEIQAIMDAEFGIHGAELNDSKSPVYCRRCEILMIFKEAGA